LGTDRSLKHVSRLAHNAFTQRRSAAPRPGIGPPVRSFIEWQISRPAGRLSDVDDAFGDLTQEDSCGLRADGGEVRRTSPRRQPRVPAVQGLTDVVVTVVEALVMYDAAPLERCDH